MVPPMRNPEAPIDIFQDPSFEEARTDGNCNVPILSWEAVFNDKKEPWSGKEAKRVNNGPDVVHKSRPTASYRLNEEHLISKKVKSAMKYLAANEL